jgi:hypothetical protein
LHHSCLLLQVGAAWGGLWGSALRDWLQHWNIQPGVYGVMAASSVLAGVFRYAGIQTSNRRASAAVAW